jgi:hypothetical protein
MFKVMPPCCPHAVFTPEDSLAVGGQFYTVAHLGSTLEGVRMQEDYPHISNEDLYDWIYITLAQVFRECHRFTTSAEEAAILSSTDDFLKAMRKNGQKKGRETFPKEGGTVRNDFLKALRECKDTMSRKRTAGGSMPPPCSNAHGIALDTLLSR